MLVFADKTTNLYEMSSDEYRKLLNDNITKTYQKSNVTAKNMIDMQSKSLAKSLNLDTRMERYAKQPAFITLKDHKENFQSKKPCRLINPAKSEIGVVSKAFL